MQKNSILLISSFLIIANVGRAETLFGPGTIQIATNQTILINTFTGGPDGVSPTLIIDGVDVSVDWRFWGVGIEPGFYAVTGPHSLLVTNLLNTAFGDPNDFFVSFQRLTNSPIKTIVTDVNSTNLINVPAGKTIQLLPPLGDPNTIKIQPQNATNWFTWAPYNGFPSASITGPATIAIAVQSYPNPPSGFTNTPTALSYYFTDEVVQFPPSGLPNVPDPVLEVNIEKSYDLTNWVPSATFHTQAEAKAFYRIRMLK